MINKECYATGFVRPKTTSLFFDKIWIPRILSHNPLWEREGYNLIPRSVLLHVYQCDKYKYMEYKQEYFEYYKKVMINKSKREKNLIEFEKYILSYPIYARDNCPIPYPSLKMNHKSLTKYLYSKNRNYGISKISRLFQLIYNTPITPVFFARTQFENQMIYKNTQNDNSTKSSALSVCINYIPDIVEEKLDWNQVIEIRNDKKSIESLRRFRNWSFLELENATEAQITESLNMEIENYKSALKKHGILTKVGSLTTIMSATATVMDTLANNSDALLATGIAVSAALITFTTNQFFEFKQTKSNPIAFIYDTYNLV